MEDDSDIQISMKDVNNSSAFSLLNDMVARKAIMPEKSNSLKEKYKKLHDVVLEMYEAEKLLLKKAKSLNQEVNSQRSTMDSAQTVSYDSNTNAGNIRRELLKAESEVAMCVEKESLYLTELKDLQQERSDLAQQLEVNQKRNNSVLEPQILQLQSEMQNLKTDTDVNRQNIDKLIVEKTELQSKTQQTKLTTDLQMTEIAQLRISHSNQKSNPEKLKKQTEVVQTALHNTNEDIQTLQTVIFQLDSTSGTYMRNRKELEDQLAEQNLHLQKQRNAIIQKEKSSTQILSQLEKCREEAQSHLLDKIKLEVDQKNLANDAKTENEYLLRQTRKKDNAIRAVRRAELGNQQLIGSIPELQSRKEEEHRSLEVHQRSNLQQKMELHELKNDVDVLIVDFLNQESVERDVGLSLQAVNKQRESLRQDLTEMETQRQTVVKEISELQSLREMKSREAIKAKEKFDSAEKEVKAKGLMLEELKRTKQDILSHLQDITNLFEAVKKEKNNYIRHIQTKEQEIAEMTEKIKIIDNEIGILRNNADDYDRALSKERTSYQAIVKSQDITRVELNKMVYHNQNTREKLEEQVTEIDRLNTIINLAEQEMVRLRYSYEQAIEQRNYIGLQLINRNDELCILYEKHNLQSRVLKNGQTEMLKKKDEIRHLNIEMSNIQRELAATGKLIPKLAVYEAEIVNLQNMLSHESKRGQELSQKLENPKLHNRWRALGGKDQSVEELKEKLSNLERSIDHRHEQLLEKELILDEITTMTEKVSQESVEGRDDTIILAKNVNDSQNKIRNVTTKTMALVSELSMTQAINIKQKETISNLEKIIKQAEERKLQNLPPTDDAEEIWLKMEKERMRRKEENFKRAQYQLQQAWDGTDTINNIRTTAEPRLTAYIDIESNLPVSYGSQAPFKPTMTGSTMRHIRAPIIKDIDL